jgi:hypothetical protein
MEYGARIALAAVLALPLAANSAAAQVWAPGDDPSAGQAQRQQQPFPDQPGPDPQRPNTQPRVLWPPPPANPQPAAPPSAEEPPANATTLPPPPAPAPVAVAEKPKNSRLTEEERLELIRYVSGEFAKAKTALPGGNKTLHMNVGEPLENKLLVKAMQEHGVSVSPGDRVQITKLSFGGSVIDVEINGGSNRGRSWRDRIQITGGGMAPISSSTTVNDTYGPRAKASDSSPGVTLQIDFGRPLPEMTPDELKLYLSTVLDFSNERSAAVTWAQSQPPAVREAIAEKRPIVGMNQDQVIAAMGRAEHKVRETQPDGTETEDWIYGTPPGKTVFVRFAHDKVIQIDQYPLPAASTSEQE